MSRFRSTIVWVSLSMLLSACGGGDTVPIGSIQMGGSIQGRPLALSPAVSTIVGSSTSGSTDGAGAAARFWNPEGITTDGTNLYVADSQNHRVQKFIRAVGTVSNKHAATGTKRQLSPRDRPVFGLSWSCLSSFGGRWGRFWRTRRCWWRRETRRTSSGPG